MEVAESADRPSPPSSLFPTFPLPALPSFSPSHSHTPSSIPESIDRPPSAIPLGRRALSPSRGLSDRIVYSNGLYPEGEPTWPARFCNAARATRTSKAALPANLGQHDDHGMLSCLDLVSGWQ